MFPVHLSGVCDITRCLYDSELYKEAPATQQQNPTFDRLLAVADLQRRADYDLLYRMTAYRKEQGWGNNQASLNLTKATIAYIAQRISSGVGNLTKEGTFHTGADSSAHTSKIGLSDVNDVKHEPDTGIEKEDFRNVPIPSTIANKNPINIDKADIEIVLGMNCLYALELMERIVATVFPVVSVRWYVVDIADLNARNAFEKQQEVDSQQKEGSVVLVYEINKQRQVLRNISSDLLENLQTRRTLLALSVLDCAENFPRLTNPAEQWQWTTLSQRCLDSVSELISPKSVVLLSGEPIDLSGVSSNSVDLVLSTTTVSAWLPVGVVHVYMPVISTPFFEMNRSRDKHSHKHSPHDLLEPNLHTSESSVLTSHVYTDATTGTSVSVSTSGSSASATKVRSWSEYSREGSVAYLYHRCDRPIRELLFDTLKLKLPVTDSVVPLGRCAGSLNLTTETIPFHNHNDHDHDKGNTQKKSNGQSYADPSSYLRLNSRFAPDYLIEAIELYRSFKFVVAFENSRVSGYITEKLLTAFLAGAVPIYYGAPDVAQYFNPAAFIDCGGFNSVEGCADKVRGVLDDTELYARMRTAPAIVNLSAWAVLFPLEVEEWVACEKVGKGDCALGSGSRSKNGFIETLRTGLHRL